MKVTNRKTCFTINKLGLNTRSEYAKDAQIYEIIEKKTKRNKQFSVDLFHGISNYRATFQLKWYDL